jgi:hypothetical protein
LLEGNDLQYGALHPLALGYGRELPRGLIHKHLEQELEEQEHLQDWVFQAQNVLSTYRARTGDEAEDINDASDKDESTAVVRDRAPRGLQVKFPTEDEFQGGYIWRHDFLL